jgi:hypothetical protein
MNLKDIIVKYMRNTNNTIESNIETNNLNGASNSTAAAVSLRNSLVTVPTSAKSSSTTNNNNKTKINTNKEQIFNLKIKQQQQQQQQQQYKQSNTNNNKNDLEEKSDFYAPFQNTIRNKSIIKSAKQQQQQQQQHHHYHQQSSTNLNSNSNYNPERSDENFQYMIQKQVHSGKNKLLDDDLISFQKSTESFDYNAYQKTMVS